MDDEGWEYNTVRIDTNKNQDERLPRSRQFSQPPSVSSATARLVPSPAHSELSLPPLHSLDFRDHR